MRKIGDYRGLTWSTECELSCNLPDHLIENRVVVLSGIEKSIAMAEASGGFRHELAANYAMAGRFCLLLGRNEQAKDMCYRSLEIADPMSNRLESGHAHAVLAEALATGDSPDFELSEAYVQASLSESREAGAKIEEARGLLSASRVAVARGELQLARERAERAREVFSRRGAMTWEREAERFVAGLSGS